MEHFIALMGTVYNLFNIPLNIYGFEFSLWHVIMFGIIVSLVFGFVGRLINEE